MPAINLHKMPENIFLTLILSCILSAGSGTAYSQQRSHNDRKAILTAAIDSVLSSEVNEGRIPGAVIEIRKGNDIIVRKAWGLTQKFDYGMKPAQNAGPMTYETLFDIASLTKAVGTTTSVMLLADRGLLNVNDKVGKYIEAFSTPDKKEITIRHLLTHTAGLYEWYPVYYKASDKKEAYKIIGDLPLQFPVGKQRRYSDLGFVILGEIIEKLSGMDLDKFMEKNIFIPLKMNNTLFNPLKNGRKDNIAATSHGNPYEKRMVYDSTLGFRVKEINPDSWNGWRNYTLRGEANDGNAWYANGGVSGAAGLFSVSGDLSVFTQMLLNRGKAGQNRFISEKTIKEFLTPDNFKNGLGWMMDPDNSFMKNTPPGTFGHTGFTGTSIVALPQTKISVVLLINRENTGLDEKGEYYNLNPLRRKIISAVLRYAGYAAPAGRHK